MIKLYYSRGACSLSPHIALYEAGLEFQAIHSPTKTHQLPDGSDFYQINPLGYVPVLELTNGERLREGPAIVQYIADQVPEKKLAPAWGSMERYRLIEWLTFIGTELHKSFSPLFAPTTPADYKEVVISKLLTRLKFVDGHLAKKSWLLGDSFTVADGYLYTVCTWAKLTNVDIADLTHLQAYIERVGLRPSVQAARKAEGLM